MTGSKAPLKSFGFWSVLAFAGRGFKWLKYESQITLPHSDALIIRTGLAGGGKARAEGLGGD